MRLVLAALFAAVLAGLARGAFWVDPATRFEVSGIPQDFALLMLAISTKDDKEFMRPNGLVNGDTIFLNGEEMTREGKTWVRLNVRNEYWAYWVRKDFLAATVLPPPEFRTPLTCAEGGANWGKKAVISAGSVTVSSWYLSDSDDGTDENTSETYAIGEPIKSAEREWTIAATPASKPYSAKVLDISTCVDSGNGEKRYYYEDSLGSKLCCE